MIRIDIQTKYFSKSGAEQQQSLIIKDLRFDMADQEIVAIVGPSGAGKTTLLNLISGLDQNYQGDIKFEAISNQSEVLQTSMMFQEPRLMPWLSVLQNVLLVAQHTQHNTHKELTERAEYLLQVVGLSDYLHDYPKELSGGMCRRVALARSFMPQSQLLLMDEPFISLDVPAAEQLRSQFLMLWQEFKPSVLYVTHDLTEAISIADRVLFFGKNPASVILQKDIIIDRPRTIYDQSVRQIEKDLLSQHPKLLQGEV